MTPFDLFIFAGEPSGDRRGAELLRELLKKNPKLCIAAVAGPEMRKLPIQTILPMEHFEVMGFTDILSSLPKFFKAFFFLKKIILTAKPKAAIFIDYPGFTLRLEASLRKKNFTGKIIHYVCPTVWAWGKKRIPLMEKTIDLLLCIFPFEPKTFPRPSFDARYIGNPLISLKKEISSMPKQTTSLGLFPGSRKKEVLRNFPIQWKAIETLYKEKKISTCHISIANPEVEKLIRNFLQNANEKPWVFFSHSVDCFSKIGLALATAGTVTLELALHQIPTVVTYAIRPIDLFLAKHIFRIRLPFYSLANILGEKEVFTELFGPHFTYPNLMHALSTLFDEKKRNDIFLFCEEIEKKLGKKKASEEAASAILSSLM
ncbi:MAG: lipid-A-disaccharide synthase [Chlamydiota bacterium]